MRGSWKCRSIRLKSKLIVKSKTEKFGRKKVGKRKFIKKLLFRLSKQSTILKSKSNLYFKIDYILKLLDLF